MRKAVKWALVAAVGFVPVGANAATYVFDFSTTDSLFTVASAITTADTLNAVGGYDVLSVSGTIFGPGGGRNRACAQPLATFFRLYRILSIRQRIFSRRANFS